MGKRMGECSVPYELCQNLRQVTTMPAVFELGVKHTALQVTFFNGKYVIPK